ncbi:MAG: D-alanyl-D-alanine carboxypeptidase family protein [Alphaproteobacteria bacterium]|nr:D-alanyl-D-alanine carboxypeptidase family protein [Alphaproteobacteria bacterium]
MVFAAVALAFGGTAAALFHFDPGQAEARFDALRERGEFARALPHGERTLALVKDAKHALAVRLQLAETYEDAGKSAEAAKLYQVAIDGLVAAGEENSSARIIAEHQLIRSLIDSGEAGKAARRLMPHVRAVELAAQNLEPEGAERQRTEAAFSESVLTAVAPLFAGVGVDRPLRARTLDDADALIALAGHFRQTGSQGRAVQRITEAAAAVRLSKLGAANPSARAALLMAAEAELGLGAFDAASERLRLLLEANGGPPAGSETHLLRLLAVAERALGKETEADRLEAQAVRIVAPLLEAASRDPIAPSEEARLDRPISPEAPLPRGYRPFDLASAGDFGLRLTKPAEVDEMKLRLALPPDGEIAVQSMPARLKGLLDHCGRESGITLSLRSGFRSYETQAALYEARRDGGEVAPPGGSEHQSGLAVDVNATGRFLREGDAAYACLREHGFRFGFLLSYPPGNRYLGGRVVFEPWHWRYVGPRVAALYRAYGPIDRPLEFLENLACYERVARKGKEISEAAACLEDASSSS